MLRYYYYSSKLFVVCFENHSPNFDIKKTKEKQYFILKKLQLQ